MRSPALNRLVALGTVIATLLVSATAYGKRKPRIRFLGVPPIGSQAILKGKVSKVNTRRHRVAVVIYVQGWWTKPTLNKKKIRIRRNGKWKADVTTGGSDPAASKIAAFLIPKRYTPPGLKGHYEIPDRLKRRAKAMVMRKRDKTIQFSGYQWNIKTSAGFPFGPGPNVFSDSTQNVRVDGNGKLHLKITHRGGQWQCAEVVMTKSLGFGTYRFYLDSPVDSLDPNVVLGLFTWSDNPAFAHREIDIEMSRWGNPADPRNTQYVVQPFGTPGNLQRWTIPPAASPTTHSFEWSNGRVDFVSHDGEYLPPPASPPEIFQWTHQTTAVPPPGDETVRLNLWLFNGAAPIDGQEAEVVISRFEFVP